MQKWSGGLADFTGLKFFKYIRNAKSLFFFLHFTLPADMTLPKSLIKFVIVKNF